MERPLRASPRPSAYAASSAGWMGVLASPSPPSDAIWRKPPRASWTAFSMFRPISPLNASA